MSQQTPSTDDTSYEALQAREDALIVRTSVAATLLAGSLASLCIDRLAIFGLVTLLSAVNLARLLWRGFDMIRAGYQMRGGALVRACWLIPAGIALLALVLFLQARYGLWFAQWEFKSRYA